MLELRPSCECCDRDLPNGATDALICTYECTFCEACVELHFGGLCPNCGGDFTRRPTRPDHMLAKHPASARRKIGAHRSCVDMRAGLLSSPSPLHRG
jgi:uncharacterized protein